MYKNIFKSQIKAWVMGKNIASLGASQLINSSDNLKKIIHKLVLIVSMMIMLVSCSYVGQSEPNSENTFRTHESLSTETIKPTTTETIQPVLAEAIASPNTPTPVLDLKPSELPVIISYFQETDGQRMIISTALNFQSSYSPIPVEGATVFRAQVAVDKDLNLYIFYGSGTSYLSKLSVDGTIETVEIPYSWGTRTVWVGDQLFVMAYKPTMSVLNTDLEVTTLSPALNVFEDGVYRGTLASTNDPSPTVIWTLMLPAQDTTGDYALYRTLSLDTFTTSEFRLKIPDSNWDWHGSTPNPNDSVERSGTYLYTVDIRSGNVLLCYDYHPETESPFNAKIELYASKFGETVTSSDYCCSNNTFDIRGNSLIENVHPETCSTTRVLGLSDLQPIFDITEYLDTENRLDNWVDSNGFYWQIFSNNQLTVIYSDLQQVFRYVLPSSLPIDLVPGTTLVPAFLIEN